MFILCFIAALAVGVAGYSLTGGSWSAAVVVFLITCGAVALVRRVTRRQPGVHRRPD